MGRSSGYCFRIIACGSNSSESVDRDDLNASAENNGSDKRGWSFRKRSAGHQVLTSTVITEIPSENKNSEPVVINYEPPVISVPEKTTANLCTEELPCVSTSTTKDNTVSSLVTEVADKDESKFDSSLDESSVIVIQSAVRKYLAQRELIKYRKIVILQAAVRGHLVRCRAAGTLRCIQSIVKMQALVRARQRSMPLEKTSTRKKGKQDSKTLPHPTYTTIEKLLSNRFAIQLLESTPRTKHICIKYDPSKDDPAWKWLERWTSVSSPQLMDPHASNAGPELGPEKPVLDVEQPKRPSKRAATEQADSEERKSVFGSRKPSNSAFIAAHSRFEELTSTNKSLTSINSSNQEHMVESPAVKSVSVESVGPPVYKSIKLGHSRNGGSECGTELSVTSMLDSPDPSEIGNTECNKEVKVVGTELTRSISNLSENFDCNTSNEHIELELETGRQMYKSSSMHKEVESPETSTKGHVTASEHVVTPSSQISDNKRSKKVRIQKPKPWSNTKRSTVRNSLDHLPKEAKPTNRRDSLGSQSSEQPVDQEPRDSCSSNSIPSYMQITESAKAKALANNSPSSSPDVQSKEAYLKKRHSLPGSVSGRHGSPRLKRTPQQTTKGKSNPERKWQR
ncbi:putative IQ motif, EF-hand binding protein [Helianthus annuus]|nr:putative IQ motif, EF-hand binding protein [Helianthus annuus]